MAECLTSSDYPSQWIQLMTVCSGMTVKGMEMLVVSVKQMQALTVKMETESDTLCLLCVGN